jgi:hypothetical protein
LKEFIRLIHEEGEEKEKKLDHQQQLNLDIRIPAGKWTWYVFK